MLSQWVNATSNKRILQRSTSATSNDRNLQRVTSDFFPTSKFATSNEWFYNEYWATSEFQRVTSNEWNVKPSSSLNTLFPRERNFFHWEKSSNEPKDSVQKVRRVTKGVPQPFFENWKKVP